MTKKGDFLKTLTDSISMAISSVDPGLGIGCYAVFSVALSGLNEKIEHDSILYKQELETRLNDFDFKIFSQGEELRQIADQIQSVVKKSLDGFIFEANEKKRMSFVHIAENFIKGKVSFDETEDYLGVLTELRPTDFTVLTTLVESRTTRNITVYGYTTDKSARIQQLLK